MFTEERLLHGQFVFECGHRVRSTFVGRQNPAGASRGFGLCGLRALPWCLCCKTTYPSISLFRSFESANINVALLPSHFFYTTFYYLSTFGNNVTKFVTKRSLLSSCLVCIRFIFYIVIAMQFGIWHADTLMKARILIMNMRSDCLIDWLSRSVWGCNVLMIIWVNCKYCFKN